MTSAMSCSSVTASSAMDAASGIAIPRGIGVTMPIQNPDSRGAGMGSDQMRRLDSPATCA